MVQTLKFDDTNLDDVILNERTFGWGTLAQRPAQWPANGWFFTTDEQIMYQNTNTEVSPTWTVRWETVSAGLVIALS